MGLSWMHPRQLNHPWYLAGQRQVLRIHLVTLQRLSFWFCRKVKYIVDWMKNAYSSIFSLSLPTLRAAESSMGRVRSILSDSIQTLSESRCTMRCCLVCLYTSLYIYRYCGLHQRRQWRLWTFPWKPVPPLWGRGGNEKSRWWYPQKASDSR